VPRPVPQLIVDWLKAKGWEPDPEREPVPGDLPGQIREISDKPRRRMVLKGQYYLPKEYDEDTPAGYGDKTGLPNVLTREGHRFILLEGGEFRMGAFDKDPPKGKISFDEENPSHLVTLSSFYMQETEVSIAEFRRFCSHKNWGASDPEVADFFKAWDSISHLISRDPEKIPDIPATGVSHRVAEDYARWVGGYLPTEAQWEFAARSGGKPRLYPWPDEQQGRKAVAQMANVSHPEKGPVDGIVPDNPDRTEQGIYHLAGNVREWCRDAWDVYPSVPQSDPIKRPDEGQEDPYYVIRGGSFQTTKEPASAIWRSGEGINGAEYKMKADRSCEDLGFRVVLEVIDCSTAPRARSETAAWRETRP
jgi:formylglycine-generating enzyme required for sulfatase activity